MPHKRASALGVKVGSAATERPATTTLMPGKPSALPEELGGPDALSADTGHFSAANVPACQASEIEPLIAVGRQAHHPSVGQATKIAVREGQVPKLGRIRMRGGRVPEGRLLAACIWRAGDRGMPLGQFGCRGPHRRNQPA